MMAVSRGRLLSKGGFLLIVGTLARDRADAGAMSILAVTLALSGILGWWQADRAAAPIVAAGR